MSSVLCWNAINIKKSATAHSFCLFKWRILKNHFFHFMAPLEQGIKIAMSAGAKFFSGKIKRKGKSLTQDN